MKKQASKTRHTKSALPNAEKGFFQTADGVDLYFEDFKGEGPALFFLYGLGCSIFHWKYQMRYFAAQNGPPRRILWADYRGHGRSTKSPPNASLTIDSIANDIRILCSARGVNEVVFLGQSMGGCIALQLARALPEKTKGLVLLGTPPKAPSQTFHMGPLSPIVWKQLIQLNEKNPALVQRVHGSIRYLSLPMREIVRFAGFNPFLAKTEDIGEYVDKLFANDPNIFFQLAKDLEGFDASRIEPKINCPALILAGAKDLVVPVSSSRWLARTLPRSELEVISHGSHCPHLDDPQLVSLRIDLFLRTHGL